MTLKRKIFQTSVNLHNAVINAFSKNDYEIVFTQVPGGKDERFYDRLHAEEISDGINLYNPRIAALELNSREIYLYKIKGAVAEVGVFQGDFAKYINRFFPDRKLYLFDTFEGFDERDTKIEIKQNFSEAKQSLFSDTSVKRVLDKMPHPENCVIKKGWFPDTTKDLDENIKFCFVSLDTDLYQPILAGLQYFYPRLVSGGVIMVHDFNNKLYRGVRQAVKEFCVENNIGYSCLPDIYGSVVIAK